MNGQSSPGLTTPTTPTEYNYHATADPGDPEPSLQRSARVTGSTESGAYQEEVSKHFLQDFPNQPQFHGQGGQLPAKEPHDSHGNHRHPGSPTRPGAATLAPLRHFPPLNAIKFLFQEGKRVIRLRWKQVKRLLRLEA